MTGKVGFALYYPEIKDLIQKRTENYLLVLTVGNFSRFTVDRVESDTEDAQILLLQKSVVSPSLYRAERKSSMKSAKPFIDSNI